MAQSTHYPLNNQTIGQASNLQRLWEGGGFALTLQLPPLLSVEEVEDFAQQVALQANLFDAVLAADAPAGAVALSSLAMAVLLKRAGIETIVQFSGRDRNRLALQSDILSLGTLGIPNLLIDMQPAVQASLLQNADARLVCDLDGPALLATAVQMRDKARFSSGASIKIPPALYIGARFSLEEHIQTGGWSSAQFVVTLPVHDAHRFAGTLAAFQSAHPDFLRTRPLLVSLPLHTDSTIENAGVASEAREAGIQKIASSIEVLKGLDAIRGFNFVISKQTDLALLGSVVE